MTAEPDTTAIDLAQPSPLWRRNLPEAARVAMTAARAALRGSGRAPQGAAELAVVLGDDGLVRSLNKAWRGQDKATNVLSFGAGEEPRPNGAPLLLGDVVLAFETVAAEAAAQQKTLADHLAHLVVHGVLHLLGFDHGDAAAATRMEALETEILAGFGVADPYREVAHG
jgi:probable rRNA maturation factor